ncbi:MAG: hypothetical protein O7F12_00160, partial [Nitrospirae bacterium]|nr:hypothetical protein [Nitrospirota bacterium]
MAKEALHSLTLPQADALLEHETPWQEFVRIYTKDRIAVAGAIVLVLLVFMAFGGKVLTEWTVVFDAEAVRLPDKFKPPLSLPTADVVSQQDLPTFGIYLLGTDELGRDVFARML